MKTMTLSQKHKIHNKDLQRFLGKVNVSDNGCWEWISAKTVKGYGLIWLGNKTHRAHRVSYEYYHGDIPTTQQLDHLCRNRGCVNPEHLESVTCKENLRRGINANRIKTHCPQGHKYNKENTYNSPRGDRECRICRAIRKQEWRARN